MITVANIVAILSCGLYSTIKAGGSKEAQRAPLRPDLMDDASFLSTLLKYEFIYSTGGLEVNLENTLQQLIGANVMSIEQDKEGTMVMLSPEERRIGREHFG